MRAAKALSTLVLLSVASLPALAHWSLVSEQSDLHFVSVKNDVIAETSQFTRFSANVDDKGKVDITVDLSSVDTLIELRDQRLRDIFFSTEQFPTALLSAQLGADFLDELTIDEPKALDLELNITLHGESQTVPARLSVTKLNSHSLLVSTRSPILINASDFALLEGIQQLQSIAGLKSIEPVVPVTGVWTFKVEH
ncbi:YceI family protein [Gilvimarinus chinensis]|uniref:YceI family protein n=1 Tax=Gilvimarinus chinensis TaxID=396005 RepID=UPI00037E829F|nr:YceI family protein [Gilvimarinus chinensis]